MLAGCCAMMDVDGANMGASVMRESGVSASSVMLFPIHSCGWEARYFPFFSHFSTSSTDFSYHVFNVIFGERVLSSELTYQVILSFTPQPKEFLSASAEVRMIRLSRCRDGISEPEWQDEIMSKVG